MQGYQTKDVRIRIAGEPDLVVRALLDNQQFSDPHGIAEELGISSAQWSLFGQLWPSELILADRLARRPVVKGERILEIGCGLAIASLVAHRRGADVSASDIHPLAGPFLRENLRLNGLGPMPYCHGPWTESTSRTGLAELGCDQHAYHLIVGSDVLYERDLGGQLASFIARHAAPGAELWIVDPDRTNRSPFHKRMEALGYARTEERCDAAATEDRPAYKGRLLIYKQVEAPLPAAGS
jgi:predicted nicotinamide N-methyase